MKRTPLDRKARLRRKRAIKRANRERRAKLRAQQFGEDGKADWIRSQGCVVRGCMSWRHGFTMVAAHARSRGAGGTAEDLVPLCWTHHAQQHARGIQTFNELHGIDLLALAAEYDRRWGGKKCRHRMTLPTFSTNGASLKRPRSCAVISRRVQSTP